MAEEKNITAAETNEGAVTPPDNDAAAGTVTENNKGFTGTEVANGEEGAPKTDDAEAKKRNAENARRRREAEATEKIKAAEINAIKRIVSENPYTHQPIENEADVEEYLIMRDIDNEGGDPVTDYFKRAREKRAQAQTKADGAARMNREFAEFRAVYSDEKLKEVLNDADFSEYSEGKLGKKDTLVDVYKNYEKYIRKFSHAAENKAAQAAAQAAANAASAVGSLNNSGPTEENDFFTRDQVKAMSQAEVKANYEKIRKSMKKW